MKKKKLIGKLSLEKSKISALNGSKIRGGGSLGGAPTNCFCVTHNNYTCGSITECDTTWTLTEGTGSECECL